MKKILTVVLLLMGVTCFSQTVKELEYELSVGKIGEKFGGKTDIAYNLLRIDKLNSTAINYLIFAYTMNHQNDSINILFDRLIKENPNSPEPYLRRAKVSNMTLEQQVAYINEAYKIVSSNAKVNYELGKAYYRLFINEFNNNKNKNSLENSAKYSVKYFSNLCNQDESYKEDLRYPLLQLANYLGDANLKAQYIIYDKQTSYFPLSAFLDLPKNWQTDYAFDVISGSYKHDNLYLPLETFEGIESARYRVTWYSNELRNLKEPVLINSQSDKVFRFTYLRSFDNPIVIGIENSNNKIKIYRKEFGVVENKQVEIVVESINNQQLVYSKEVEMKGGDEPAKIINDISKELTDKEWTDIVSAINAIDFWNLPSTNLPDGLIQVDGAQWILEGKEPGKYHVVDRWSGGGEITNVCKQLMKLSDLIINQSDIY